MGDIAICKLGQVVESGQLEIKDGDESLIQAELDTLKSAWLGTLDF